VLNQLSRCTTLRSLSLPWFASISPPQLEILSTLTNLELLSLPNCFTVNVSKRALRALTTLITSATHLRQLEVANLAMVDLEFLAPLAHLEILSIKDCRLVDIGILNLPKFSKLWHLDLSFNQQLAFSEEGIPSLLVICLHNASLLVHLVLGHTFVIPKLKHLILRDTAVKEEFLLRAPLICAWPPDTYILSSLTLISAPELRFITLGNIIVKARIVKLCYEMFPLVSFAFGAVSYPQTRRGFELYSLKLRDDMFGQATRKQIEEGWKALSMDEKRRYFTISEQERKDLRVLRKFCEAPRIEVHLPTFILRK